MHRAVVCSFVAVVGGSLAVAQPGTNLLTNPGAETGDLSGWTTDGMVSVMPDAAASGFGEFVFTGGVGAPGKTASQDVDLSAFAPLIDGGSATASVSAWIQSRSQGLAADVGSVSFEFFDASGGVVQSVSFVDPSVPSSTWDLYSRELNLRSGVRAARVTMFASRNSGDSTDAFFDDLAVVISGPPCPPDLAAPYGSLDVFDVFVFFDAFIENDPIADFAQPFGSLDLFDIFGFLDALAEGC